MTPYQTFLVRTIRSGLDEVAALAQSFSPDSVDREWRWGEWSLRQHAHHLRQVEGRYLERLQMVLQGGSDVPAPVQHLPPTDGEPLEAMIEGFLAAGESAASTFANLTSEQWMTTFIHPTIWGEVTVEWWAERFVQHTAEHLHGLWMLKQLTGLTPDVLARLNHERGAF